MKSKRFLAVFICIIVSLAVIGSAAFVAFDKLGNNRKIEAIKTVKISGMDFIDEDITLIAHRGFSADAPENTLQAIEKAGEAGFKMVEFDIRQTVDGIWVVSHDDKLDRMTNGKGRISEMTYREILDFTLDNGANIEKFDKIRIPTLEAALNACMTSGVMPVIEIKSYKVDGIEKLFKSLQGKCLLEGAAIISYDGQALLKFHKLSPKTELWLLTDIIDENAVAFLEKHPEIGLSFKVGNKKNSDQKIKDMKKKGINLSSYTVNDEEQLKRLYNLGVRIFTTDVFTP